MSGQLTIDDWLRERSWSAENPKPCDCGSTRLTVTRGGCGIPSWISATPAFDRYWFQITCRTCGRYSQDKDVWLRTSEKEAWDDWNKNDRRVPDESTKALKRALGEMDKEQA